jgi:hypothetical protein
LAHALANPGETAEALQQESAEAEGRKVVTTSEAGMPNLDCQKTGPSSKNGTSRRLPILIVEHPAELFLTSDASYFW